MRLFSKCLAAGGCLLAMASLTACSSDDGWADVDGKTPSLTLASVHEQTEAGRQIKIVGQVSDADGISTIDLVCHDLNLNKRINIIEIYGEPLKTYDLDYAFMIQPDQQGESFDIDVVITDVGGRKETQVVKVTLDGDFTFPIFTQSPDQEVTVLIKATTAFNLQFEVTDNRVVDYVTIDMKDVTRGEELATDVAGFPRRLDGNGTGTFSFAEKLILPSQEGKYKATITAYDKAANEDAHATTVTSIVNVSELQDFPVIWLCDVETAAELNSDVFGVPIAMDHIGAFKYRVRYYNEKAGTQVCFLGQKTDFGPICFAPDKNDPSTLGDDPNEVGRVTLDKAERYYCIEVDTWNRTYTMTDYAIADAINPVMHMHYGQNDLDTWSDAQNFDGESSWWQEWYFGPATDPGNVKKMVQDSKNPNIFIVEDWKIEPGDDSNYMLHNWHHNGWWNYTAWRIDDSSDPSKCEYYGNYLKTTTHFDSNLDYFQFKYMSMPADEFNFRYPSAGGSFNLDQWAGNENYRKNFVADNKFKLSVKTAGTYKMVFDAHTERIKLVPQE